MLHGVRPLRLFQFKVFIRSEMKFVLWRAARGVPNNVQCNAKQPGRSFCITSKAVPAAVSLNQGLLEYILDRVPLQFKSLNYIRGRSFQQSFILIDESQNLTPHQIKTIITRAGNGSKVICLGNLAQIDTPYLNATSSGLTYLTECFKDFPHGVHIHLQGVPRSTLAEYAETHL